MIRHFKQVSCRTAVAVAVILGIGLAQGSSVPAQDPWQTIEIKADEYRFIPNRIQVKAHQPLRLVISNIGNEPHRFQSTLFKDQMIEVEIGNSVVRGPGIDGVDVTPGGTVSIKILSPPPGEYDFQCRIPSHHGMDGVLTIGDRSK